MNIFDQIEFEVNVNRIPIRAERFAEYLDNPEEDYVNSDLDRIYQAIVCHKKANEQDEVVTVKKANRHHVRTNRYDLNKVYRQKANRTKQYAEARRKKATHDGEMVYLYRGFDAPWGYYEKETVIHDSKLWKPLKKAN